MTLTAQGEELHSRLAAKVQGTAAQLYDGLPPEDLAVAQRVLTQIKERADDLSREL